MSIILTVAILFALAVAGTICITIVMTRGHRPRSVLLAALAGRWKGRLHEGGMLAGDRLEIEVEGVPGEITFRESPRDDWKSGGWTRVRFKCPISRRLRVLPKDIVDATVRRFLGAAEVQFDDPAFDERFWVESSDPAWARSVLLPDVRREFIRYQWSPRGPFGDRLLFDAGPSGLDLRISRVIVASPDMLGTFVELASTLLRRTMDLTAEAGLELEPASTKPGSACPVCGHPVDQPKPCPNCGTPHHADCWTYMGGCAIFGCESRPVPGHDRQRRAG